MKFVRYCIDVNLSVGNVVIKVVFDWLVFSLVLGISYVIWFFFLKLLN